MRPRDPPKHHADPDTSAEITPSPVPHNEHANGIFHVHTVIGEHRKEPPAAEEGNEIVERVFAERPDGKVRTYGKTQKELQGEPDSEEKEDDARPYEEGADLEGFEHGDSIKI